MTNDFDDQTSSEDRDNVIISHSSMATKAKFPNRIKQRGGGLYMPLGKYVDKMMDRVCEANDFKKKTKYKIIDANNL